MSRPLSIAAEPAVDPRGVRFSAAVTGAVLALVLLSGSGWLLAAQAAVFALGAFVGLRFAPYPVLFGSLVAPRLSPPTERVEPTPVRSSQAVGLVCAAVGTVGYLAGLPVLGLLGTVPALAAALLIAACHRPGSGLHVRCTPLRQRHSIHHNQQGAIA